MGRDREIINWLDSEAGWVINEIKSRCKLEDAEYIAMKIVRDFGYRRKDVYVPNPSTDYTLTSDINLYDELSDLVQGEDCKNGCQLHQELDGTYYFQITGANFYDKEDRYAGTDTVKVWFKEFKWEDE